MVELAVESPAIFFPLRFRPSLSVPAARIQGANHLTFDHLAALQTTSYVAACSPCLFGLRGDSFHIFNLYISSQSPSPACLVSVPICVSIGWRADSAHTTRSSHPRCYIHCTDHTFHVNCFQENPVSPSWMVICHPIRPQRRQCLRHPNLTMRTCYPLPLSRLPKLHLPRRPMSYSSQLTVR